MLLLLRLQPSRPDLGNVAALSHSQIVANQRSVEGGLTNQDMGALFGRIFLRNRLDKATAGKRFHMLQSAVPHVDRVVTTMLLDFKEVFTVRPTY